MTETISVSEILQHTISSCDFGEVDSYSSPEAFWIELITSKASDEGFGPLIDNMLDRGFAEGSSIGLDFSPDGKIYITEGHHRLTAAILLCMDEVPYSPYGSGPKRGEHFSAHSGYNWNGGGKVPNTGGIHVEY